MLYLFTLYKFTTEIMQFVVEFKASANDVLQQIYGSRNATLQAA